MYYILPTVQPQEVAWALHAFFPLILLLNLGLIHHIIKEN